NIEGESVEAIAARMEEKVKNGYLPGASAEWNSLPSLGKQASAAFKQSLEARIRVEELVCGALSKAVSGTGKKQHEEGEDDKADQHGFIPPCR
ncbi:hypothetical protein AB9F39_35690, partial [Rhizobium leguminosarum]